MSRVGRMLITVPSNVNVVADKDFVTVTGPKGELKQFNLPGISVSSQDGKAEVKRSDDLAKSRADHGLMRSLVNNMVTGVSQGFEKKLELNGVGYRVQAQGQDLKLNLGFSHEVVYKIPAGIQVSVEQNIITVSGISKQQVGQTAAEIRALKKPEPYKGKGIKYVEERIRRKAGKTATKG